MNEEKLEQQFQAVTTQYQAMRELTDSLANRVIALEGVHTSRRGVAGADGRHGQDGMPGKDGKDGKDGANGRSYVPSPIEALDTRVYDMRILAKAKLIAAKKAHDSGDENTAGRMVQEAEIATITAETAFAELAKLPVPTQSS